MKKIGDYEHLFDTDTIFTPFWSGQFVDSNQVSQFLGMSEGVPNRKYKPNILFSNIEISDMFGETGKPEFICFEYGAGYLFEYVKYIGDQEFDAYSVRDYLKNFFKV